MDPLNIIKKNDEKLFDEVKRYEKLTFEDGKLSSKVKILIALAIDASHGSVDGVKSLYEVAKKAGATDDEIFEAVRVAGYVSGTGAIYTVADALK